MKNRVYIAVGFFLAVLATTLGVAQDIVSDGKPASREEPSLRELCRREMAGIYLNALDNDQRLQQYRQLLNDKIARYGKELSEIVKTEDALRSRSEEEYFNFEVDRSYETMRANKKALESALDQAQETLKSVEAEAAPAHKYAADLKQRVLEVFLMSKVNEHILGYQIKLEFKQGCPPFRFNCPLSRKYANQLNAILSKEHMPQSCIRYADYLR